MDYFEKLAGKIKSRWKNLVGKLKAYIKRLIFPMYLFPIKLVTYSAFYIVKFAIRLVLAFFGLILDCLIFPFKSLKNFLKSIVFILLATYLGASLFVIADYLSTHYSGVYKFICAWENYGQEEKLKNRVVRIVGGNGQGTGFFTAENEVVTNFHVIADEPAPKIIFPNGDFVTPKEIVGAKFADLAVLVTEKNYPDMVLPMPNNPGLYPGEPLMAVGYPLGTDIKGEATIQTGKFEAFRKSKNDNVGYIQADINLVEGMSGGPLVEKCGEVVGINTMGLAGLSMFIGINSYEYQRPNMDGQDIAKITLDPTRSPEEAVAAFYTYLKARRMQEGFDLLSEEYLQKTNYQEWTSRFSNILDVNVVKSELTENSKNTVFVKFSTSNWVENEIEDHFYEGTWQTIKEDNVYKMMKSKIMEVENPGWAWFYE